MIWKSRQILCPEYVIKVYSIERAQWDKDLPPKKIFIEVKEEWDNQHEEVEKDVMVITQEM